MEETRDEVFEELKKSGLALYVALTAVNSLHHEVEVADASVCAHCSALADARVTYPCPTVTVLTTDAEELINSMTTSETSEPAESEELSS